MNISVTKLELIELLLKTKQDFVLEKVRYILEHQNEDSINSSIVAEPFSEEAYNKKLEKAENDFINNRVISQKDLKKKYNIQK